MKFPIDKQNELYELDRVMRVVGTLPCGLMVYVRTDEHAYAPHVHICDVETRGCRFHACVLLTEWQFYVHPWDEYPYCEGRRDQLTDTQKRQLLRVFRAWRSNGEETGWQYAVRVWNECRYPSGVAVESRLPKFDKHMGWTGAYDWMGVAFETTGWPTICGMKCRTFIRGPEYDDGREPHFHITFANHEGDDFRFEISLIDILAKDELNLVAMRDSRDPEGEIVHLIKDECSWKGYEDLREGVRAYLAEEETDSMRFLRKGDTHLHSIVRAWDWENHDEGICGYVLDDYLRQNGISVLPKYAQLMKDSHNWKMAWTKNRQ